MNTLRNIILVIKDTKISTLKLTRIKNTLQKHQVQF